MHCILSIVYTSYGCQLRIVGNIDEVVAKATNFEMERKLNNLVFVG